MNGGGWTQIRRVNDSKQRVRLLGEWPGGCENSTQELGIGIFECSGVDRGKIEENKSGTRKIVGEGTVTAACCAALFKSVRATFDRAPASIVYPIPTGRTDVILLFGKGRLGGREWECGFAKIGTRTCLDFMTALLEFKRYERRIYSVIH